MTADGGVSKALALYREGRHDHALAALDEGGEGADSAVSDYLRGIILKDSGRDREAVDVFDRAIARRPDLERAYYHRGTARFLAGDRPGALRDLERAVQAEPDFLFAVYNYGVAAVGTRDWDRAKWAFARCIELDPQQRGEYVDLLVEIGRGEAQEEVYAQGHRLKNLLGVVGDHYRAVHAEVAGLGVRVPDTTLERAGAVADELRHLYEDMVQFLRAVDTAPPAVTEIDVADLVEKALFAISGRLKGIDVEKDFALSRPNITGDRKSLGEALINVLTNAVEACLGVAPAGEQAPGGSARITVSIRAVDSPALLPEDAVRHPQHGDGLEKSVAIEVRDTGPGIAPEHLPRIFEFGYTTKRFGSGLGLSYADRVVRAHGGRIDIQSPPGLGARVTLVLPVSPTGGPNLRTLGLRSLLFDDLRGLAIRGGTSKSSREQRPQMGQYGEP